MDLNIDICSDCVARFIACLLLYVKMCQWPKDSLKNKQGTWFDTQTKKKFNGVQCEVKISNMLILFIVILNKSSIWNGLIAK